MNLENNNEVSFPEIEEVYNAFNTIKKLLTSEAIFSLIQHTDNLKKTILEHNKTLAKINKQVSLNKHLIELAEKKKKAAVRWVEQNHFEKIDYLEYLQIRAKEAKTVDEFVEFLENEKFVK